MLWRSRLVSNNCFHLINQSWDVLKEHSFRPELILPKVLKSIKPSPIHMRKSDWSVSRQNVFWQRSVPSTALALPRWDGVRAGRPAPWWAFEAWTFGLLARFPACAAIKSGINKSQITSENQIGYKWKNNDLLTWLFGASSSKQSSIHHNSPAFACQTWRWR